MFIRIQISSQQLELIENQQTIRRYPVSSGLNGEGCEKGSGKTPLGKHIVRAKIGTDQPERAVFVGRRATGEIYSEGLAQAHPQRDWVLSRIMWLSGLEINQNRLGDVDTMQRYIYIHGTPDSEPMGIPKSHGCIRMRNSDIIELFDLTPPYTQVDIVP